MNLKLWEQVAEVPKNAQKPIPGGRLKGMTDINPVWRLKKLTEMYGPCGIGWYYEVTSKTEREVANGEILVFVDINLYVKHEGEWSKPIHGTGGNKLATSETKGIYYSDEAYKMAETDAISVACKSLGFGSDVYWAGGRSKYSDQTDQPTTNNKTETKKVEYTADSIFTFGKYKDKTYGDVYKENPSYFEYLSKNSKDEDIKAFSKKLWDYHEKTKTKVEQTTGDAMFDGQHQ